MVDPTVFHARQPQPPLYPHLQVMWAMTGPAATHPRERLLPTGTVEIVFNLDDPVNLLHNPRHDKGLAAYSSDLVCGPQTGWFTIATHTPRRLVGLHFQAGGLAPFIDMPLQELRGHHVSLADLWGGEGRRISDLLRACSAPQEQFHILERWLRRRLRRQADPAVSVARRFMQRWEPEARVAALIDQLGFSRRHFNRLFQNAVGMTAKTYCRVSRFQATLERLEKAPARDWSELALDHGFYDQAHLINEFKAFSGFAPETYLLRRGYRLNHLPIWE
ncbi:helix-turn-helix domain-containing protein [Acanthopleuribacter pedis]|uniref:AraC family transcriptional regulator n=1 Tax=Acanthopleuribacter pedis TaxID=442870 RepID=A0A8J7QAK9_9BACT|nr:helix-turn-helix domain-containing protein [Acanthopleuribacter pedis]MBO1320529.1 AraC family transcriptional regulator [Acanthopleuribacter pedis]